ncbi:hypothetical protein CSOJ01_01296 [Colletotrichum sojae]|uniref:Uncharacterized protein n=1 Tax=Colletotrichum sojae TaxID=2175907 RepID=A0A8H6JV40_9PEZI|nr:hypothetical protein CSOJ01_01296 [Colletotrichum sojae]
MYEFARLPACPPARMRSSSGSMGGMDWYASCGSRFTTAAAARHQCSVHGPSPPAPRCRGESLEESRETGKSSDEESGTRCNATLNTMRPHPGSEQLFVRLAPTSRPHTLVFLEGPSSLARPRTAGSGDKQQQGDRFAWALGMTSLAQPRRAPPRSTTTTIRHLASRVASHHITFTFLADDERVSALFWLARLACPGLGWPTPSSIGCVPRSRAPVDPIYLVCSALLDAYLPSQVINKKPHHRHGIPPALGAREVLPRVWRPTLSGKRRGYAAAKIMTGRRATRLKIEKKLPEPGSGSLAVYELRDGLEMAPRNTGRTTASAT